MALTLHSEEPSPESSPEREPGVEAEVAAETLLDAADEGNDEKDDGENEEALDHADDLEDDELDEVEEEFESNQANAGDRLRDYDDEEEEEEEEVGTGQLSQKRLPQSASAIDTTSPEFLSLIQNVVAGIQQQTNPARPYGTAVPVIGAQVMLPLSSAKPNECRRPPLASQQQPLPQQDAVILPSSATGTVYVVAPNSGFHPHLHVCGQASAESVEQMRDAAIGEVNSNVPGTNRAETVQLSNTRGYSNRFRQFGDAMDHVNRVRRSVNGPIDDDWRAVYQSFASWAQGLYEAMTRRRAIEVGTSAAYYNRQIVELERKGYTQEDYEAAAMLLLQRVIDMHANGVRVGGGMDLAKTGSQGVDNGISCSTRLINLSRELFNNKRMVIDIMEGSGSKLDSIAVAPNGQAHRKSNNRDTNQAKQRKLNKASGKEGGDATKDEPTPAKSAFPKQGGQSSGKTSTAGTGGLGFSSAFSRRALARPTAPDDDEFQPTAPSTTEHSSRRGRKPPRGDLAPPAGRGREPVRDEDNDQHQPPPTRSRTPECPRWPSSMLYPNMPPPGAPPEGSYAEARRSHDELGRGRKSAYDMFPEEIEASRRRGGLLPPLYVPTLANPPAGGPPSNQRTGPDGLDMMRKFKDLEHENEGRTKPKPAVTKSKTAGSKRAATADPDDEEEYDEDKDADKKAKGKKASKPAGPPTKKRTRRDAE